MLSAPAKNRVVTIAGDDFSWHELALEGPNEASWAHPGAAAGPDGALHIAGATGREIISIGADGTISRARLSTTEAHGLAVDHRQSLWVVDNGHKPVPNGLGYQGEKVQGRVLRVGFDGVEQQSLTAPGQLPWHPCSVAVHNHGRGSGGQVWVADGYGQSLVHAFDRDGRNLWTTDGSDSGIAFSTPHGILVDDSGPEPRLLVADRGNRRIVALGMDGVVLGTLGSGVLTSPSGLALREGKLWVTELHGSLKVLDLRGELLGSLGADFTERSPGWPNALRDGATVAPPTPALQFSSPHGIAASTTGDVIVGEWRIGGRVVLLRPAGAS